MKMAGPAQENIRPSQAATPRQPIERRFSTGICSASPWCALVTMPANQTNASARADEVIE